MSYPRCPCRGQRSRKAARSPWTWSEDIPMERAHAIDVWQLPLIIPLILLGPLSEEFGWRGFLQKRVNNEFSPILGSLVIGITWSLWHLPLFFMLGSSQHDFNMPFLSFLIAVTSSSLIYTYVYIKSNESLFSAILLHWIGTYIMQVIASQVTRTPVYNYLECLPAFLIGILFIIILKKHGTNKLKKKYAS